MYVCVCIYIYIYMRMYICMCIYIYIYICIYVKVIELIKSTTNTIKPIDTTNRHYH